MNKFDLFKEATTELLRGSEWLADARMGKLSGSFAQFVATKPKFYVPISLVRGQDIEVGDYATAVRMPFPELVVLTEITVCEIEGKDTDTTAMFCVMDVSTSWDMEDTRVYHVLSATRIPGERFLWGMSPYLISLFVNDVTHSVTMGMRYLTKEVRQDCEDALRKVVPGTTLEIDDLVRQDAAHDAKLIVRTLIYMNIHGVEHKKVTRPPPKKTKRAAKLREHAMYDYHVLKIGGELWDSPHTSTGTGPGKRSHLRRGHLRRRWGRVVWIRETYVHGSKEGFVRKDYEVEQHTVEPPHE